MDGVESIDVKDGKIAIAFDAEKVGEKGLAQITNDSTEKLGYKIESRSQTLP